MAETSSTTETDHPAAEHADISVIASSGDLILAVRREEHGHELLYRVDTKHLVANSDYFTGLLEGNFSEAIGVKTRLKELKQRGIDFSSVSIAELPKVEIVDIGRTSHLRSIRFIMADFLRVLHGLDLPSNIPPLQNVANLAVVADRFGSVDALGRYVRRRKLLQAVDRKTKTSVKGTEEQMRQKLMLGIMLGYDAWTILPSKWLIVNGSRPWFDDAMDTSLLPLWWNLPSQLEDELVCRREYSLATISSIQTYFLDKYVSGERQCKLGYADSRQCDSFQLGEMIRFFTRIGTLQMQCAFAEEENHDAVSALPHSGNINIILDLFRSCPNYQLNQHHHHCGLRSKLSPLLDPLIYVFTIESGHKELGVCGPCWRDHRDEYKWLEAKRPLHWSCSEWPWRGDKPGHGPFRDMFMAVEKNWSVER